MLAVVAPGQGSQRQQCLLPWLAEPRAAAAVATLAPGWLVRAGTDPDADVVDTAVAQPLIVLLGLAAATLLPPLPPGTLVAGHSVGELTALAVAGALQPPDALRLAETRGRAMARAAEITSGGMTALLGGDPAEVTAAVERAGAVVANHNGAGQLVAAGSRAALDRLAEQPPPGTRLRPLTVAGAFHSDLMRSAEPAWREALAGVTVTHPRLGWLSGLDGAPVRDADEATARLAAALVRPVRWDRCLQAMADLGVTGVVELPPAGVLTGLVRRVLPDVEAVALQGPADVPAAVDLIGRHLPAAPAGVVDVRLVVSPATGTWHRRAAGLPAAADRPEPLGWVEGHRDRAEVTLPSGTRVVEWLVRDRDPVRDGQPLARLAGDLEPEAVEALPAWTAR